MPQPGLHGGGIRTRRLFRHHDGRDDNDRIDDRRDDDHRIDDGNDCHRLDLDGNDDWFDVHGNDDECGHDDGIDHGVDNDRTVLAAFHHNRRHDDELEHDDRGHDDDGRRVAR